MIPPGWLLRISRKRSDVPDSLYAAALKLVFQSGNPNISFVQRKLSLRYSQAEDLVRRMEREGHVSAPGLRGVRVVFNKEPARSIFFAAERKRIDEILSSAEDGHEPD